MELLIHRLKPLSTVTIGSLFIDGVFECFTQEPPVRSDRVFIPGESALPPGRYNVSVTQCKRFSRPLPLLVSYDSGPPEGGERRRTHRRVGMRIHPGRPQIDSGCEIVLGQIEEPQFVTGTRLAFDNFFLKLSERIRLGQEAVELEIA